MTEEPFRWLEAMANRREYVSEQLKVGTPVLAASLAGGIVLAGVGSGHSKVFEIFDRQAMGALGHPADIEKIRQALIDAAHLEGFARAPEDVSLRRLAGFGLGPQLKAGFEQVFSAPYLAETLLAELGHSAREDTYIRLHTDGAFEIHRSGAHLAAASAAIENPARQWLESVIRADTPREEAVELLLQAWWMAITPGGFPASAPGVEERRKGWREAAAGKTLELAWLDRGLARAARYRPLSPGEVGLA